MAARKKGKPSKASKKQVTRASAETKKKPATPKSAKPKQAASVGAGLAAIVLAAGKGTRMRSARAKVLHELLGRPLVAYPVGVARELGAAPVVAVLGHQLEAVEASLRGRFGAEAIVVVEQAEQRGTGHAVKLAMPALEGFDGVALILSGDVPLLRRETLEALVGEARKYGCLALVTSTAEDPTGYGRIVRDGRGHVTGIVEHKDATPAERAIDEVNAGIYAAPAAFLRDATAALVANNAQGEYYLTDVVAAAARSIGVATVDADARDVAGINDREQLAAAEATMRARINRRWMEHATLRDPAGTDVEPGVEIGVDAEIGRGVALRGRTRIGHGARVDDGSILVDTEVGAGVHVQAYTVSNEAVIGANAIVGPFARLRPGTVLGEGAHVGNFVELKKTTLGKGSKANHLSYLGDTTVGEKVNVGAGTITCNYNGYEKQQTIIEDGAFIGSDSQLVAPVRVGKRAVVAAGATITQDVPEGALAINRVPQVHKPGYADAVAARYADRKKK
ncbi:MAG TPA: bifunctional UDP-N-acetylglucosamine diphosphorylase/glucosamine-1-phosphate N-acetyltransferase GlmU [Polyangia bacterium]|nr:bifunctional UDP-N-acetylglucosamine diphosphorylase/glucosamine-1-phosphate N-acetyltransferase GlmU [Polyangia bacterium]